MQSGDEGQHQPIDPVPVEPPHHIVAARQILSRDGPFHPREEEIDQVNAVADQIAQTLPGRLPCGVFQDSKVRLGCPIEQLRRAAPRAQHRRLRRDLRLPDLVVPSCPPQTSCPLPTPVLSSVPCPGLDA